MKNKPVQLELFRNENSVRGLVCCVQYSDLIKLPLVEFLAKNAVKALCDFRSKPTFDDDLNNHVEVSSYIERVGIVYRSVYLDAKKAVGLSSAEWRECWKTSKKWHDLDAAMALGICVAITECARDQEYLRSIEKSYLRSCNNFSAEIPLRFLLVR